MPKLIEKLKAEPVMAFVLTLALILAVLITAKVITLEDVNRFVATVGAVIPVILAGLALRKLVSPATGDAGAKRENAVVARTLGRVASGGIDPETWGGA